MKKEEAEKLKSTLSRALNCIDSDARCIGKIIDSLTELEPERDEWKVGDMALTKEAYPLRGEPYYLQLLYGKVSFIHGDILKLDCGIEVPKADCRRVISIQLADEKEIRPFMHVRHKDGREMFTLPDEKNDELRIRAWAYHPEATSWWPEMFYKSDLTPATRKPEVAE